MPDLPALTSLDLSYSDQLTSLQGMTDLPQLRSVDLRRTIILDLAPLSELPRLDVIVVSPEAKETLKVPPSLESVVTSDVNALPSEGR
jgi:Leucine-rich repeat (LRR) protein